MKQSLRIAEQGQGVLTEMSELKKYVQVGLGGRSAMFRDCIINKHTDRARLVGLCDSNPGRLEHAVAAMQNKGLSVKGYLAGDFRAMIKEQKPDVVIVTTKDCFHDEYICRAMNMGCDVITEKPMTTDEKKCRKIINTRRRTGGKCVVTFNYRYAPPRTQVKDLLMSGVIGDILAVDFNWVLDTRHGADYFRRWHRNKLNSGGLLVHKATHHFDLVNWWLSDVPVAVHASGGRKFYTPRTAKRYGLVDRGERCLTCPEKERCAFMLDLTKGEAMQALYLDCEKHDGYFRDRCVFNPENGVEFDPAIDIEDTLSVRVNYAKGAILTYSLVAYSPWEGYLVTFTGTRGRIEHKVQETSYVNSDGSIPGELVENGTYIRVSPHRADPYAPDLWVGKGGHGGADPVMLDYIFDPEGMPNDKYKRAADERAGAYSVLCGIAGNKSILTGRTVLIDSLVKGLEMPDCPPMPRNDGSLPMPGK